MPLVTPLSAEHDLETKELAEFFNETLGFCPNSVLTMQRRPAISKAFINLNKAVMANEGRVTSALKRLIAWVSSNATGCRYCQAHAIRAAERYGAEQAQLENIEHILHFRLRRELLWTFHWQHPWCRMLWTLTLKQRCMRIGTRVKL